MTAHYGHRVYKNVSTEICTLSKNSSICQKLASNGCKKDDPAKTIAWSSFTCFCYFLTETFPFE